MINKVILKRVIVVVFSTAMFTDIGIAYAFDMCKIMFDKMNQLKMKESEWRDNYRDRDDYYGDPEVSTGYGYDSPGYGYGGPPAPSYGYTVPAYATPQSGNDTLQVEIYQYRDRDDYYGDPEVSTGYGNGSPDYVYGGPPAPSYGYTVPAYAAPQPGNDALQAEIYQLKLRIKNLEKALIHESSHQQSAPTDPGTS